MGTQMLTSKQGAELISLKVDGVEKIHQGVNCLDEKGRVYWNKQYTVLFPTVGKCKKNQTLMHSKNYEMQFDGFAKDMDFEPVSKLDNFHSYIFKSNKKLIDKFPYEFSLSVTYRTDGNKLTTIYKVLNEGDIDMPFGIGGKPAFKIDLEDLQKGNYYIEFEEDEDKIHFLYLVDGLVGTEYAKNIMENKRILPITTSSFTNDAVIMKGIKSKKVSLKKRNIEKPILNFDYESFPYLAIWSKPKAPFICVCPWMTLPDSSNGSGVFRQKTDILHLPPNKEFECKYTVEFF